jgi:hypothetical protein
MSLSFKRPVQQTSKTTERRQKPKKMTVFLRELVSAMYADIGLTYRSQRVAGQICVTPVLYSYENRRIWRPCETDETGTQASRFRIVSEGADAYNRSSPLKSPDLSVREEFPVIKAKRRPVLIVKMPDVSVSGSSQPSASRPLPVVLPLYSVEDLSGRAKYEAQFLARAQQLEFPEFFFLPAQGAAVEKDSLIALSRITHIFEAHLEPTNWRLSDETLRVLVGQIVFWLTGVYGGDYKAAREMLFAPQTPGT